MGKISPIANKYIIHATIQIDGVVDRPDVIGAIFGQTEGLLGEDLELRELQRSGRIGRIEVNLDANYGKTKGAITIPSSLDKSETAIVGAALEIIQRIGPCNAKIKVENIEDVRVLKRNYVINRAKELLRNLMEDSLPDSQELSEEVATSVRVMEIQEWGSEKLPAGPAIDESDEIILVEGRADVLVLLKYGFKNAIGMNGSNVPKTLISLCKQKTVTAFLDGDRGGDLNLQELMQVTEIDYVCKAPDGKEVEELTKKEIHKALRSKISSEQANLDYQKKMGHTTDSDVDFSKKVKGNSRDNNNNNRNNNNNNRDRKNNPNQQRDNNNNRDRKNNSNQQRDNNRNNIRSPAPTSQKAKVSKEEKSIIGDMMEDLVGTKGACIMDSALSILGKVPLSELKSTLKSFDEGVHAIALDGDIDQELVKSAESANVKFLVGMDSKVDPKSSKIAILTINDL